MSLDDLIRHLEAFRDEHNAGWAWVENAYGMILTVDEVRLEETDGGDPVVRIAGL